MAGFDIRDLMLEAMAEAQEIVREALEELAEPRMVQALQMKWRGLDDTVKERLMRENPEAYREISRMIKKGI